VKREPIKPGDVCIVIVCLRPGWRHIVGTLVTVTRPETQTVHGTGLYWEFKDASQPVPCFDEYDRHLGSATHSHAFPPYNNVLVDSDLIPIKPGAAPEEDILDLAHDLSEPVCDWPA
jgi:hypothetical protein